MSSAAWASLSQERSYAVEMPTAVFSLVAAAAWSMFILGDDILVFLGFDYANAGGGLLEKLHPAFYLSVLACVAWATCYRHGLQRLLFLAGHRACFLLFICALLLIGQSILFSTPVTNPAVTFLGAFLTYVLLLGLNKPQRDIMLTSLLILLTVNSLVGITEYFLGKTIVPANRFDITTGEYIDASDWNFVRAAGLFGHPLKSSLITGLYLAIFVSRYLFLKVRSGEGWVALVALASMPLFGGRGAIAALLLIVVVCVIVKCFHSYKYDRIERRVVVVLAMSGLLLPLLLVSAYQFGLLDPVVDRMVDDKGSAETRISALLLTADTPPSNLLLGNYDGSLAQRQIDFDTELGIEISWLALLLNYGAVMTMVIIYSLAAISSAMVKKLGWATLFPTAYFFIALTSGTGLSSKTLVLSIFLLMLYCLFPWRDALEPRVQRGREFPTNRAQTGRSLS